MVWSMSEPLVSVIIVNWNAREYLQRCLQSIDRYLSYEHEVVVVDNASTDGSADMVRTDFPDVQLIANPSNRGFAAANNQGWLQAKGQYVAFLNADTELIEEPFLALIERCRQDHAIGCLGPRLLNADHSIQLSVRSFPGLLDQIITLCKLRRVLAWTSPMKKYLSPIRLSTKTLTAVDQIMGAAMLFPRSIVSTVGGWDDRYWIWFEEVDLCQRVRRAGLKVMYDPTVAVVHHGGESFRQVVSLTKQRWFIRSLRRYTKQYWPAWQATFLWPWLWLSLGLTGMQMIVKPR